MALNAAFSPVPMRHNTFYLLDALRGIAALSIVLLHYKNFGASFWSLNAEAEKAPAFRWILDPILTYGANAVALFWIISGVVMMHVYGHQSKEMNLKIYANRRFARLYPLHFTTLILITLLQVWSNLRFGEYQVYDNNDSYHFILQIFFASNWGFEEGLSYNGPIWSVSCEIIAYGLFFIFLKSVPVNRATTFSAFLVAAISHKILDNSITYCIVCFYSGSLVYSLLPRSQKCKGPLMGYTFAALAFLIAASTTEFNKGLKVLIILTSLVSLVLVTDLKIDFQKLPLLGWLGNISYSSYLWHTPIIIFMILVCGELELTAELAKSNWIFLLYVCAVLTISTLSYRYFEVPTQRFFRNIADKRRTAKT